MKLYKALFIPILACLFTVSFAQQNHNFCGTESSARFISALEDHRSQIQTYERLPQRSSTDFPVTVHIIRKEDGTGGIEEEEFLDVLTEANSILSPANIALTICDSIRYIDSDQFYDFFKPDESSLFYPTQVENTLNLYISNSITYPSGKTRCGYAYFPGWKDMVMVDKDCMTDGSTFIHEVGHYFGLYHTHGNSNSTTDELNDLSNCYIAGDDICDTPADPFLAYTVDTATCVYNGSLTDANGQPYTPDPSNIMSYAPKHCKTEFSEGQYDRMSYVAKYLRAYLACPILTAEFDASPEVRVCNTDEAIELMYTGIGGTSFQWDIGADGTVEGHSSTHQFVPQYEGRYKVCLTATRDVDTARRCLDLHNMPVSTLPVHLDFDIEYPGPSVNTDLQHGWDEVYISESNGGVLIMENFHYNTEGEEDIYYVATVDLADEPSPYLIFDLAYAAYSPSRYDGLRIEVSSDCGSTYDEVYFAEGLELASSPDYVYGQWMPSTSEDWRTEAIDLSAYSGDTIIVRLVSINGHGNYLYLDNVKIDGGDPLPLQFIAFEGIADRHGNHMLTWVTADESDVAKYYIEKSVNGFDYVPLASIMPENLIYNTYHFTVYNPTRVVYYRIRATHRDGSAHYSPVIQKLTDETEALLFPNPAKDIIYFEVKSAFVPNITVIDLAGRLLPVDYTSQGDVLRIDVSDLQRGLYTLIAGDYQGRFLKID